MFDLIADSAAVINRITENSQGRRTISAFDADLHTNLQATVALIYAIELDIPIYFVDASGPLDEIAEAVTSSSA